ncbi:hypothetical protein FTX61_15560 [Nitriliruptoraceae bacterium ZYF776]|nr:hypothetical protein [Profundirhabdus halotolerans]
MRRPTLPTTPRAPLADPRRTGPARPRSVRATSLLGDRLAGYRRTGRASAARHPRPSLAATSPVPSHRIRR